MFVCRTALFDRSGLLRRPHWVTPDDGNAVLMVVSARHLHGTKRWLSASGRSGVRSRTGRPPFLGGPFALQTLCKLDLSCACSASTFVSGVITTCLARDLRAPLHSCTQWMTAAVPVASSLSKGSPGFQSFLRSFTPQPNAAGPLKSLDCIALRAASGPISIFLLFGCATSVTVRPGFCVPGWERCNHAPSCP
jgi:hypothetical protein